MLNIVLVWWRFMSSFPVKVCPGLQPHEIDDQYFKLAPAQQGADDVILQRLCLHANVTLSLLHELYL